jgi:hypothetical protein
LELGADEIDFPEDEKDFVYMSSPFLSEPLKMELKGLTVYFLKFFIYLKFN